MKEQDLCRNPGLDSGAGGKRRGRGALKDIVGAVDCV